MGQIKVEKSVPFPAARAWEALANFGEVYRFHPVVERSPLLGEETGGVGARRRCEFTDGNHVIEEVVGWEEGRSMDVDIVEGSMPLSRARARIEVVPIGESSCEIHFAMDYTAKYGPLGSLMDFFMMRRMFRTMLGRVLDGLGTHLETGRVVGEDGQPALAA